MNTRWRFLLALGFAAGILAVIVSAQRFRAATKQLEDARSRQQELAAVADEVLRLRAMDERIGLSRRPEQDVIARVNATLAEVGLPSSAFAGQSQESDSALPGSTFEGVGSRALKVQSVRVSLRGLSTAEIGQFLACWDRSQPLWTPIRIELGHGRNSAAPSRFDVTMLISAMYLEEAPPSS